MALILGAVADDVTGASDLALTLAGNGMSVVQTMGQPGAHPPDDVDALVVALKTRTAPVETAVSESVAATRWLLEQGVNQLFFKYCSTFDSTDRGNIGPVAEALLEAVEDRITVVCPAFPENGRTVFKGHLFVGHRLLSESGMRDHPLTPMRDPDLVRVLRRQCTDPEIVGIIPYETVEAGSEAIRTLLSERRRQGRRLVIVDALCDRHLRDIGRACEDLTLITGGSGIAMGLPENYRRRGLIPQGREPLALPTHAGPAALISGSCSLATRAQVRAWAETQPTLALDPVALAESKTALQKTRTWVREQVEKGLSFLVHSTAEPGEVEAVQEKLGREAAGTMIEQALAEVASEAVGAGVRKLVVAGGETSGAVARALGVAQIRIGPEIDPGVPWTVSLGDPELLLAFKSGNFGGEDFFVKALEVVP